MVVINPGDRFNIVPGEKGVGWILKILPDPDAPPSRVKVRDLKIGQKVDGMDGPITNVDAAPHGGLIIRTNTESSGVMDPNAMLDIIQE